MTNILDLKIFSWIDEETVKKIIEVAPKAHFDEGSILLIEWMDSDGKGYIIESWKVKVKMKDETIAELGEGDIFWEIALLNEEKRTATVEAMTDLEVIVLSLDNLIEMINNDENKINKEIIRRLEENLGRE